MGGGSIPPAEINNTDRSVTRLETTTGGSNHPSLSSRSPPPRLCWVPQLPDHLLRRTQDALDIIDALESDDNHVVGISGMGGAGKSTLAAEVARSARVSQLFPDGVIWLHLGKAPRLKELQVDILRLTNVQHAFCDSIEQGRRWLGLALSDRAFLVVLDDAWSLDHILPFDITGLDTKLLVTTRKLPLLEALDAHCCQLRDLTTQDALELLANAAHATSSDMPPACKALADVCGNHPLALAIAGGMARRGNHTWQRILHRLQSASLEKMSRRLHEYPYSSLLKCFSASTDDLDPTLRLRYLDLAVFSDVGPFPSAALEAMWKHEGLGEFDVDDVVVELVERNLLRQGAGGHFSLHDMHRLYLCALVPETTGLHDKLVRGYTAQCGGILHEHTDDGYFYYRFAHHLHHAGRHLQLQQLLIDISWLEAKLFATDIYSVLHDFSLGHRDHRTLCLESVIRQSAHVLSIDKAQFRSQLHARLLPVQDESLHSLKSSVDQRSDQIWLRLRNPVLIGPNSGLARTVIDTSFSFTHAEWTKDGKHLCTASLSSHVRMWNTDTSELVAELAPTYPGKLTCATVSGDGKRILAGAIDGTILVWQANTLRNEHVLRGHTEKISGIGVTHDGTVAVSVSCNWRVKTWMLNNGREWCEFRLGKSSDPSVIANFPYDDYACVLTSGGQPLLWKVATTLPDSIRRLSGIRRFAVTPDASRAAVIHDSAGEDVMEVVDLMTGESVQHRRLLSYMEGMGAFSISPSGDSVVYDRDSVLDVWHCTKGDVIRELHGHSFDIVGAQVLRDGVHAMTASTDGSVKLWDLNQGKPWTREERAEREERQYEEETETRPFRIFLTSDGQRIVCLTTYNMRTLDVAHGNLQHSCYYKHSEYRYEPMRILDVIDDNQHVLGNHKQYNVVVRETETGKFVSSLHGHTKYVTGVSTSPDGQALASVGCDMRLVSWDLLSGAQVDEIVMTHAATPTCVKWISKGRAIVGHDNGMISVCNMEGTDLTVETAFSAHSHGISTLSLSPCGLHFASASRDGTVRIWDTGSGRLVAENQDHSAPVLRVVLTNCDRVASVSADRSLRLWRITDAGENAAYTADHSLTDLCVTPDGRSIIALDANRNLHFLSSAQLD